MFPVWNINQHSSYKQFWLFASVQSLQIHQSLMHSPLTNQDNKHLLAFLSGDNLRALILQFILMLWVADVFQQRDAEVA